MAKTRIPNPCFNAALEKRLYPCSHWQVPLPFTPSTKQLTAYAKAKNHKLVLDRRSDPPKVTFDEKARVKLKKMHPGDVVYHTLDAYKRVEKVRGTYVEGLKAHIRADGRVGGEFNHTPITLRLAQKEPSLLNLPRFDKGDATNPFNVVRALYVAAPGHILMARDYTGIEAKMVGYLAADPTYIRLAALGVHDFFTSHVVGKPADLTWSDADLRAYFAEVRAAHGDLRQRCKMVVHASNYLVTPYKMALEEPDIFPDVKTAKWYQDAYLSLFPSIGAWQKRVCDEAEQQNFVVAPSGFRMYYSEPYAYTYKPGVGWLKEYGEQAKEVVAAKPQHMGAVYLMTAATCMVAQYPDFAAHLRLLIHDELFWECPSEEADLWDARVRDIMEAPLPCMPCPEAWGQGPYLAVGTEGKRGPRWSEMK